MKIFASNQFTPVKSLKKTVRAAAIALPLMAGATSCTSWLCLPPPPPPHPYHSPLPPFRPHPHPHLHRPFGLFGEVQSKDSLQYNDVFELSKNDMAYLDNTEQK